MRVTDNMRFNTTVNSLFNAQSQYNGLLEKMASMKKVNRASDDPIAATKIIDIRQGLAANEQYRKNIADSDAWTAMTESKLSGAYDLLVKAREIAVGQATGTANATGRKIASQSVQSLIDEMAGLANAKLGDRYLFAGSKNGSAPFSTLPTTAGLEPVEISGNNVFAGSALASGTYTGTTNKTFAVKITGGGTLTTATARISTDGGRTWNDQTADGTDLSIAGALAAGTVNLGDGAFLTFDDAAGTRSFGENDLFIVDAIAGGYYRGNDEKLSVTISRGMTMAYNVTGAEAFAASGASGVDVFKTLNDLKQALDNDDVQGIFNELDNLKQAQDQVILNQSLCGTKANQTEMAKNSLDNLDEKLTSLLSEAQDADLADYATQLSMKELALQASYSLAAKISNMTILNFLK